MSDSTPNKPGRVFLVGAGPGDPRLLTLRAVECLQAADLVVYDYLVPPELLDHAPRAQHIAAKSMAGSHAERHAQIQAVLVDAALKGQTVVHLKGGDPWLFGRGGEEAAALRAAGIEYEVVPGVTAALAAAACSGIPLTQRGLASAVTFVTGHDCVEKKSPIDWQALARLPGTLAIYMGLARLEAITAALLASGQSADTPAATIQWAATNSQKTVVAELGSLATAVRDAGLTGPAVTLIGPVVKLRERLAWLEQKPLFGRHVLVTRPRHQAPPMLRRLAELGAIPHPMPTLEIGPPSDLAAVDSMLDRLPEFQWLVFTSANGVEALLNRLLERGHDLRRLGGLRLAAIGTQTAAALVRFRLRADVIPREFTSEGLSAALAPLVRGQRVLLARADRGRQVLQDVLQPLCHVEQIAVYSQKDALELDPVVGELIRRGQFDFVTFTSSNSARAFFRLLGPAEKACLAGSAQLVSISPVTSAAIREFGFEPTAEAREYTADGVIAAVLERAAYLSSRRVSMQT